MKKDGKVVVDKWLVELAFGRVISLIFPFFVIAALVMFFGAEFRSQLPDKYVHKILAGVTIGLTLFFPLVIKNIRVRVYTLLATMIMIAVAIVIFSAYGAT